MSDNKYNRTYQSPLQGVGGSSPLQGVGGMGVEGASLAIRTTPQAVYIDAGSGERAHQRGTLRYAVTARQLVIYPAQGYEPVAAARFDRGITVDGTPLTPDNAEELLADLFAEPGGSGTDPPQSIPEADIAALFTPQPPEGGA